MALIVLKRPSIAAMSFDGEVLSDVEKEEVLTMGEACGVTAKHAKTSLGDWSHPRPLLGSKTKSWRTRQAFKAVDARMDFIFKSRMKRQYRHIEYKEFLVSRLSCRWQGHLSRL